MTNQTGKKKTIRRQHTQELWADALARAEKLGAAKAAKELVADKSQPYEC